LESSKEAEEDEGEVAYGVERLGDEAAQLVVGLTPNLGGGEGRDGGREGQEGRGRLRGD